MKKGLKVVAVVLCVLMIGGCGKEAKTEYDTKEFWKILSEINQQAQKEIEEINTEYFTKENHTSDEIKEYYYKIGEIRTKYAKKQGIEAGQEIIINGYYNESSDGTSFFLWGDKTDSTYYIPCVFADGEEHYDDGDFVKINGIFDPTAIGITECKITLLERNKD